MTWEAILRVADRIQTMHPDEATKLRFIASNVQWLENRVNELVMDEWAAAQEHAKAPRRPRKPRLVPSPPEAA